MIYAGILAGGTGTRMGIQDMPKQFLTLGQKPIIMHTVEKFLFVPEIDIVYVAVHPNWMTYFEDLLQKYVPTQKEKIRVVSGGKDRNDSIMNIIQDIQEKPGETKDDILITHDAVRPFVSYRMIQENIAAMKEFDVADTVVIYSKSYTYVSRTNTTNVQDSCVCRYLRINGRRCETNFNRCL